MRLHPEMQLVDVPWPAGRASCPIAGGAAVEPGAAAAPPLAAEPEPEGLLEEPRYTRSEDGRYEAFVDDVSATLVVRDLRTGATHKLVDRHLAAGARIVAAGECVWLVIANFTHLTACIEPFRVVDLHMEGR